MSVRAVAGLALLAAVSACGEAPSTGRAAPSFPARSSADPEAESLLGQPLHAPPLSRPRRADLEARLDEAVAGWRQDPDDEETCAWLARRLALLGRYREAVAVLDLGLTGRPDSVVLLAARAHRLISMRRLDDAGQDLDQAAASIRQAAAAGASGRDLVRLRVQLADVLYMRGVADYVRGRVEPASETFAAVLRIPGLTPDMAVAVGAWQYLALSRSGREEEADALLWALDLEVEVNESAPFRRLLLAYRRDSMDGLPDEVDTSAGATLAYGAASWHLVHGNPEEARRRFAAVVAGDAWPAYGHIAAEAELCR